MDFKVMRKPSWGGTQWFLPDGTEVKLPLNFYAKEADTGRQVLVVAYKSNIRDHGASWDVYEHSVLDKATLEVLGFYVDENGEYVDWWKDGSPVYYVPVINGD